MIKLRHVIFLAGVIIFALWFWPNIQMLTGDQDGTIRLVLAGFFSLAILLRLKPRRSRSLGGTHGMVVAGLLGACFSVIGYMFEMHQLEWLGIILVFFACLRWSLPDRWSADIVRSIFVLYWIHPLPGRLFGWFEVLMQKLSVEGGEWFLHILNVRVWADGMYLHTGLHVYGVDEACSGMRTAVTMLICVVGVSILLKQRWWETLAFMFLGGLQVLMLNILRVAGMVYWSDRMPVEWAQTFLHDSLGVFLLLAILLIQFEMSWWKVHVLRARKKKERIEKDEVEAPDQANTLPRIWYLILKSSKWVAIIALAGFTVAFVAYKRRPAHRAVMISDVVDGLMTTDLESAQVAIDDALALNPGDRDLIVKKVHVLILAKKFEEVLKVMETIKPPLGSFETVMKSWALMSLNHGEQAMAAIRSLPLSQQNTPGVAIVKAEHAATLFEAEHAATSGYLDIAVSNVIIAAKSSFPVDRVRALYPFLATHEQWNAIAAANSLSIPHKKVQEMLIAVQAYIRVGDESSASRTLEAGLERWPNDPNLVNALYYMAMRQPGTVWSTRFAQGFEANVHSFGADEAARGMGMAFRLGRPDLGWMAYRRLESLDSSDPELLLAPARYGGRWSLFRREQIGVPLRDGVERIDISVAARLLSGVPTFANILNTIPLKDELWGNGRADYRALRLQEGLTEFEKRIKSPEVTERIDLSYPIALGIAGRFNAAHKQLDRLIEKYPEKETAFLFQRAEFFHAENRWQESYEELRMHIAKAERPALTAHLMLADDLIKMNLGVYALELLQRASKRFPGSPEVELALASVWNVFGYEDMALHMLGESTERRSAYMKMKLLFETGRYREARKLALGLGTELPKINPRDQAIALPPAELTTKGRWRAPFTQVEIAARIKELTAAKERANSDFMRGMFELEEAFLKSGDASVDQWAAAGRDPLESVTSLHRLSLLAGRQGAAGLARQSLEEAARIAPSSPILRRMLVACSEGDEQVVRAAYKACPDDPEIWLAWLMLTAASNSDELLLECREAVERGVYPVETLIRASDFLLRKQHVRSAVLLAKSVTEKERGLLAADMLGLRCAMASGDSKWAMESALRGVQDSLDPTPFYEMIVVLKSASKLADGEMIEALEHLELAYPSTSKWGEQLGMVYFEQGNTARAMSIFNALIKEDIRRVTARSLLLAAESARLEGENDIAIGILRDASQLHPDNSVVLNNLVYSLAQGEDTLPEALDLLEALEKTKDKTFHVYDTIALVHMKNRDFDEARRYMQKALDALEVGSYSYNEVKLNSAELLLDMGEIDSAERYVEEVRDDPKRSTATDRRARGLQGRIRRARRQPR